MKIRSHTNLKTIKYGWLRPNRVYDVDRDFGIMLMGKTFSDTDLRPLVTKVSDEDDAEKILENQIKGEKENLDKLRKRKTEKEKLLNTTMKGDDYVKAKNDIIKPIDNEILESRDKRKELESELKQIKKSKSRKG